MLTDDSYLAGVQVLSYTLRKEGSSTRPLVVLVSKDMTKVWKSRYTYIALSTAFRLDDLRHPIISISLETQRDYRLQRRLSQYPQ